jgi:hypothetical protein
VPCYGRVRVGVAGPCARASAELGAISPALPRGELSLCSALRLASYLAGYLAGYLASWGPRRMMTMNNV